MLLETEKARMNSPPRVNSYTEGPYSLETRRLPERGSTTIPLGVKGVAKIKRRGGCQTIEIEVSFSEKDGLLYFKVRNKTRIIINNQAEALQACVVVKRASAGSSVDCRAPGEIVSPRLLSHGGRLPLVESGFLTPSLPLAPPPGSPGRSAPGPPTPPGSGCRCRSAARGLRGPRRGWRCR